MGEHRAIMPGWPYVAAGGHRRVWWSDANRDRLTQMWRDPDVGVDEIGDFFEIAPQTVRGKACQWKLGPKAGGRRGRPRRTAIAQYEGPDRPAPPIDPRARDVTGTRNDGVNFMLTLSCGHVVSRRIKVGAVPSRAICDKCPAVGGIAVGPTSGARVSVPAAVRRRPASWFDWTADKVERLKTLWADDEITVNDIADELGARSAFQVRSKVRALGLPKRRPGFRPGRRPSANPRLRAHGGHQRRFVGATGRKMRFRELAPWNPAIKEGRTRFRRRVISSSQAKHVLVSGENSSKIGRRVMKGRWEGMPIFTLTLEERRTCPSSCAQWANCYGNNMNWALRLRHDEEDFSIHLSSELLRLNNKHPDGFVVRLHVLGDFFSVQYVEFWREALAALPGLHVFGYTAWALDTPIGGALWDIVRDSWDRFALRFSNLGSLVAASEVVQEEDEATGVICPAEKDENRSCGTCGMCWASKKGGLLVPAVPIITFLRH